MDKRKTKRLYEFLVFSLKKYFIIIYKMGLFKGLFKKTGDLISKGIRAIIYLVIFKISKLFFGTLYALGIAGGLALLDFYFNIRTVYYTNEDDYEDDDDEEEDIDDEDF